MIWKFVTYVECKDGAARGVLKDKQKRFAPFPGLGVKSHGIYRGRDDDLAVDIEAVTTVMVRDGDPCFDYFEVEIASDGSGFESLAEAMAYYSDDWTWTTIKREDGREL